MDVLNGQGETRKSDVRAQVVKDFNNAAYDVLLTNVLRGLDLTTCNTCILYTIDPNPQKMVQFEGRIKREFDVKNKKVWVLVSAGKEKKFVETELKLRVDSGDAFTVTGNSLVLSSLRKKEDKSLFESAYALVEED
ncbi:hypothetical protein D3C71_1302080 [compost metagenome]